MEDFGDEMGLKLIGGMLRGGERLARILLLEEFRPIDERELRIALNRSAETPTSTQDRNPELAKPAKEGVPRIRKQNESSEGKEISHAAIAAVFDSQEDAREAVDVLSSMGVAAAVTRHASDGTHEVVVDVSPTEAHSLGREIWLTASSERQQRFEKSLRAVSTAGTSSKTIANSAERSAILKLGGVS